MSGLLSLLEQEGRGRGFLAYGEPLTRERASSLVRDMPYRRASSRRPEAIINEWRGACSGKHYLLADVFSELGLESQVMMCAHQFTPDNTRYFPSGLRELVAVDPIPDVHTYLRMHTGQGWTVVDATWPSSAGPLGMTVNLCFSPSTDMTLAYDPIETLLVPADQEPREFKELLIEKCCGSRSGL